MSSSTIPLSDREEAALIWAIRTRDPHFADWEGFTRWLEEDAANAVAYDAMMVADAALPEMSATAPLAANDDPVTPFWRRRGLSSLAAVAAVAILLLSYWQMAPRPDPYSIETAPGARREIALADGSRIALNGGSRVDLDRSRPRYAVLARGEALFTIRHDAADPFEVTVGAATFQDAGTIFNIVKADDRIDIGVAEGKVIYDPRGQSIALDPGQALQVPVGQGTAVRRSIEPQAVSGWRTGRLSYQGERLDRVAADLSRNLGVRVDIDQRVRAQNFTGTLQLDGAIDGVMRRIAPVLGVRAQATRDGWRLVESDVPHS